MIKKYIDGRSCAILGLGVSNLPLARLLVSEGVPLSVYDRCSARELGFEELEEAGAHFYKADSEFQGIDGELIFRSPGIRPDREGILKACAAGAELISETELFLKLTKARTFAVTGSDGKTTTTTLAGLFCEYDNKMRGSGRTYVGGNIGKPLLTLCTEMNKKDLAVLELSSFQLMTLTDSPECAAITNISQNHLDWHKDMNEYIMAKKNIVGERTKRLVTNADCIETLHIARELCIKGRETVLFSSRLHSWEEICKLFGVECTAIFTADGYIVRQDKKSREVLLALNDIKLPGVHNTENYMTAIGLTYGYVDKACYRAVARDFYGVEHRLELVREKEGVSYYNSSIDSSPTRTRAALSAMKDRSLVLICGGYDKKLDYAPLAEAICTHGGVHTLILTGVTGRIIEREVKNYSDNAKVDNIRIKYIADFESAVRFAAECAIEGDAVLLSPASASFDAFKNFMERGSKFKETVHSL